MFFFNNFTLCLWSNFIPVVTGIKFIFHIRDRDRLISRVFISVDFSTRRISGLEPKIYSNGGSSLVSRTSLPTKILTLSVSDSDLIEHGLLFLPRFLTNLHRTLLRDVRLYLVTLVGFLISLV